MPVKIIDGGWLDGQSGGSYMGNEEWIIIESKRGIKIYIGDLIRYMPDYLNAESIITFN